MLCLPAKAADAPYISSLKNGDGDCDPTHAKRLGVANIQQSVVGNCLNKAISQRVGGNTKCPDVILKVDPLHDRRIGRS